MNQALHEFADKVMAIDAGYSGMGGATSGIVGSASTENGVILELRKNLLAFAKEYAKPAPDPGRLSDLATQLDGSFETLRIISVISDKRFDWLSGELHKLMSAAAK